MHIWVDADACPRPVKDILFRAAKRVDVPVTLVANQPMWTPPGDKVELLQVRSGTDRADDAIAQRVAEGDLVITADIPLAARVVEAGGQALSPRGTLYTEENVGQRLSVRDFMSELRDAGVKTGGPSSFGRKERRQFANQLDRLLTRYQSRKSD